MTKVSGHSKSPSKLVLLIILSTLCTQALSIRLSSNSKELSFSDSGFLSDLSTSYTLSSIFPSSLNFGCVNINTIANHFTTALSEVSHANSVTQSIIDTTVSTIVTALLSNDLTKDVAASNACLGNFGGSATTAIDECSAMLLPDSSQYSVIAFDIPIPGGVCSAEPKITMASFCLAIGKYNSLPSISIQANAGTLSCLATLAGSGIGYALSTAIEAGLDTVSLGVSLTSSFEKSVTIYDGNVETVQVNGNYYDYVSLNIDPDKFGLPDIFSITGSATRVIQVAGNAATWVSKLSTASNAKDVAVDLFGNLSMLVDLELDLTISLASKTLGFLPDLGPYTLGEATLYATTSDTTLASGQSLKAGVYTYVAANNILGSLMSDIVKSFIGKIGGILNTLLSDFGISITKILDNLTPTSSSTTSSNAFGFLTNSEEISLYVKTSVAGISTIIPNGGTITVQCHYKYSTNKFSCQLNMGSISKFFTGVLNDATWVIKKATAFFDETGTAFAFAEKSLAAFTDTALQTTANDIKKGALIVAGYTTQAAAWAEQAVYQCGYQTVTSAVKCGTTAVTSAAVCGSSYVTDAAKCGTSTITSAAKCGTSFVTSAAKCGYTTVTSSAECGTSYVTSAAKCGYDTITSGAICGVDTIGNCLKSLFSGHSCKKVAKSCQVPASCSIANTCNVAAGCSVANTCSVSNTCSWPNTCNVASTCKIANSC